MKKTDVKFDIGRLIKNFTAQKKISQSELGKLMNKTRVAGKNYTEKKTLQTETLLEICYTLRHNFFQDIANSLPRDFSINYYHDPEKEAQEKERQALIEQLTEENKRLKIQNEILMKVKT